MARPGKSVWSNGVDDLGKGLHYQCFSTFFDRKKILREPPAVLEDYL